MSDDNTLQTNQLSTEGTVEVNDTPISEVSTTVPQDQALGLVERTEKAIKDLTEQNNRTEQLVLRAEEANVKNILGGRADAGGVKQTVEQEQETEVDKQVDQALKQFVDTGF